MIIFPAIDLLDKKAVRLYKGDYKQVTVYSDDPLSVAKEFEKAGATWVHLVDLEGAKDGTTPNRSVVESIVKNTHLSAEIGGGIRTMETVDLYVSLGVARVILGTAALQDRPFLEAAVRKYGEKIAVSADVSDGYIAIKGWIEKSNVTLEAFLDDMQAIGVGTVICTDISKDGAMNGTNADLYASLAQKYTLQITASGGVSSLEEVRKIRALGLYGAIIGKAYYTGAIDLREAIEVAK